MTAVPVFVTPSSGPLVQIGTQDSVTGLFTPTKLSLVTQAPLLASGVSAVAGSFSAAGSSAIFTPPYGRPFNLVGYSPAGYAPGATLNGVVYLARSVGGGPYLGLTASGSPNMSFAAAFSETWVENEVGATYQLVCASITGGQTVTYRISA